MKTTTEMPRSGVLVKNLEFHCLNLIMESCLIEAIKKDETNLSESATLMVDGESDFDRAERIMALKKKERDNKKSLIAIRSQLEIEAMMITEYLSGGRNNFINYTLKREGYQDRSYHFQLNTAGQLTIR